MIVNIIALMFIVILLHVKLTGRRKRLGLLVMWYYIIFVIFDVGFFGLEQSVYMETTNNYYDIGCLLMCVAVSIISSYLYYKGSNLAGLYALWLIINAILCINGTINGYDAIIFNFVYNLTQNINIIIDLSVVILGTDSLLMRDKRIGSLINNINRHIDSINLYNFNTRS